MLAVTINCSTLRRNSTVFKRATQHHIPEDGILHGVRLSTSSQRATVASYC
jgi:hypothetical protein